MRLPSSDLLPSHPAMDGVHHVLIRPGRQDEPGPAPNPSREDPLPPLSADVAFSRIPEALLHRKGRIATSDGAGPGPSIEPTKGFRPFGRAGTPASEGWIVTLFLQEIP